MRKTLAIIALTVCMAHPAGAVDPLPRLLVDPSSRQAIDPSPRHRIDPSVGQTVYLPIYSHIWHGDLKRDGSPERLLVSTLVSIRNTDADYPITLRRADYYDTDGKLLHHYTERPRVIAPMATVEYFINLTDSSGGSGANMLVHWTAEQPVSQPVIEGVHAYFRGTQALGFVTNGRVTVEDGANN